MEQKRNRVSDQGNASANNASIYSRGDVKVADAPMGSPPNSEYPPTGIKKLNPSSLIRTNRPSTRDPNAETASMPAAIPRREPESGMFASHPASQIEGSQPVQDYTIASRPTLDQLRNMGIKRVNQFPDSK